MIEVYECMTHIHTVHCLELEHWICSDISLNGDIIEEVDTDICVRFFCGTMRNDIKC